MKRLSPTADADVSLTGIRIPVLHGVRRLVIVGMLVAWTSILAAEERDVVKPIIGDKLISVRLTHQEMVGGELDRRIMDLIHKNFMVLDLDRDWLDKFKNRTDRGNNRNVYYGIGKVLDAGSLFAQYTGDPKVVQRAQYIMDQLRSSRDPDGYLGFWKVEPNNYQNVGNWILHEQEYINLALVRNYRTTGSPRALADAKIMADYIMRMFPANEDGEHIIPSGTSIAGITEGFVQLYRVTGERKYLDFARSLQYEPHWYYLKPYDAWEKNISQARYHVYVMLSHMYPDTELYRLIGGEDYLKKSLWMKQELLERGRMIQDGRVALLRGPVLFTFSDELNAAVLEKCPNPRNLVLDPASIGDPIPDDSVRPNGQKVTVKAWTNAERTGDPVDVVLTEFIDPNGIGVYFKVPNLEDTHPIRIMDDELLSEPRRSANGEITFAWYGPKSDRNWKGLFTVAGELVADLAADYRNPQGKLDVAAAFPDTSQSGSWSLYNCKNDGLLSTAEGSGKIQRKSKFRTDLGKYADLFGDPAPGQEKTLKLRVQDLGGNIKYIELPEDAPLELP